MIPSVLRPSALTAVVLTVCAPTPSLWAGEAARAGGVVPAMSAASTASTASAAASAAVQSDASVSPVDIQRLQDRIYTLGSDLSRLRSRDSSQASRLEPDLDDLRDEVIYLKVKLRKEGRVPRAEYADLRDRLDTLGARIRGEAVPASTSTSSSTSSSTSTSRSTPSSSSSSSGSSSSPDSTYQPRGTVAAERPGETSRPSDARPAETRPADTRPADTRPVERGDTTSRQTGDTTSRQTDVDRRDDRDSRDQRDARVTGRRVREIPVGTELDIRLQTFLTSETAQVEDRFEATTLVDLIEGNEVLVPAGSVLRGVVSSVKKAGRIERKGSMTLSFDQLTVDGRDYTIRATVTQALESAGVRGDVGKIGTGAGVGAIIGGILGGFKGALAGILIGGGGTIAATEGTDVKLDTGTILRVRFDSAVPLEPGGARR